MSGSTAVRNDEGSSQLNIILVTGANARARTISLDWRHWAGGGVLLFALFIAFTRRLQLR